MFEFTIPILFLIDGLIVILAAFFAQEIGLAPDVTSGRLRYFLLFVGAILIFISILLICFKKRKDKFFISGIKSETVKILFFLGHIWLIIFLVYVWFITYGNWTTWNRSTNYYDQLANAFHNGQLNIDIKPGAALLAAPDPYNPINRPTFNSNIWDMSLYKSKLYVYWGPVPALFIAPIKFFSDKKIADIYLVFAFFSGLLIFNSLILLKLWKKFFTNIPVRNLLICIPLIGLILPILWSVNGARVYEAAIGAGQFFLIGGVFFALSAFNHETKIDKAKLFLAGLFWACSVGSRAINALSVIFLTGLIVLWIVKNAPGQMTWKKFIPEITALITPLIVGAVAICWYNWARFDSPFEFGFRYQITILDLNKQSNLVFQPDYFFLNLYSTIFQPFGFVSKFPFIYPTTTLDSFNIAAPKIYFAGRMTGLLFCAPFLVLSLVHSYPRFKLPQEKNEPDISLSSDFVIYLLAGSFLISFLSLMFFFFGQMRYIVDVISQITLLAIIGYWKIISLRQRLNSVRSKIFLGFANVLLLITICAGLFLAVSSDYDRLKTLNPVLFEKIVSSLSIQK
jgi:hypothetical protein